ncbi:TIGR00730 family Rossman fold protein [Sedimenticola selenatireducens]|uniref:LOG family protein n=1 Tax=Sedimenticola selenatireducens TaxID=191960 RepID=UPI00048F8031|nr:TIGR00730 family Rossman fold protein [Sedimenticola selenatireducens]
MSSESEQAGLLRKILQSSSYRLAQEDKELLASEDLRPVRLQLELLKPERYLREHNVRSTIVVFGSARLLPPDHAEARLEVLERRADPALKAEIARARKQLEYSRYYVEARHFAKIVSRRFQKEGRRDFVVVTGGGPGIMEAANRGAYDAGERSIGLNVTLPHEQAPNPFVTPELCFQFRYFGLRKMHFLLRARGLVAFPGGFGTLDELFETLTLMQTKKVATMPVVLVGQQFWSRVIDFNFLLEEGMIDKEDLKLFSIVDSADEAITVLCDFYQGTPPE